ncbi:hypothetical protein IAE39_000288 [Pseudomonas sp. S37]|nr:hypothetical protein [Pseudomonas sp. S37]
MSRWAAKRPQKSQCINNQIRMITGIGTPIIHSNTERMLFSFCQKEVKGGQSRPYFSQCMNSAIRMITGIGTPIIHSNIERMSVLLT